MSVDHPSITSRWITVKSAVVCFAHRVRPAAPAGTLGVLPPVLARLGAIPGNTGTGGPAAVLAGVLPAARV
ncbi:hypothetical protein [Streptomyces malaysiense]|uniref:Uncharacterized protein n=1 Tax=Streptomyces malaysiense TaxID=1428626 RepID=A0A1J4QAR9_9ACTN|nr:hypothetical protein VT52_000475 [Streptomyces malaysiense]